jgi:hypothetical protein
MKLARRRMVLLTIMACAATQLASGVASAASIDCVESYCRGTGEPDALYGTDNPDDISGYGAGDTMYGYGGTDALWADGMVGDPSVVGLHGDDLLDGGDGNDSVTGYGGSDLLSGGGGDDIVSAQEFVQELGVRNPGEDAVEGGAGNDDIRARDGYRDVIDCGEGEDSVSYDAGLDELSDDCESPSAVAVGQSPSPQVGIMGGSSTFGFPSNVGSMTISTNIGSSSTYCNGFISPSGTCW